MIDQLLRERPIDKDSPVPYYYQIAQALREALEGIHRAGDGEPVTLPSEPALAETFGVARGTVRHALQLLEREGLICRQKGRGTFAGRRRVELDLTELSSISQQMRARNWTPAYRLLDISATRPTPPVRAALDIGEDELVWTVRRLRLADGEPVCLEQSFLPFRLVAHLDREDLAGSLYDLLRTRYGLKLRTSDQTIRTRKADAEEARLLSIRQGDPVFAITGIISDPGGTPVEYSRSVWRGDRYDLQVRLVSRE